jgi:hypothetical protein
MQMISAGEGPLAGNFHAFPGIRATIEVMTMKLKFIFAALLGLALSLGGWAQDQSDNGGIKQDTKDAAHSTGRAAKKTGRKIKHGTKKVVNKGAHATRKGADKVEDKTSPTPTPTPPQI